MAIAGSLSAAATLFIIGIGFRGMLTAALGLGISRWLKFPLGIGSGLILGVSLSLIECSITYLLATTPLAETFAWIAQCLFQYTLAGLAFGWLSNACRPIRPAEPTERAEYLAPPDVEWIEHPVVVTNSRVVVYHHGSFGTGKCGLIDRNAAPEYLYSDCYLIVEDSEADFSRFWVSARSWRPVEMMLGQPVGFEFTLESLKGPQRYKVLAIHIPSDGRVFRLADGS